MHFKCFSQRSTFIAIQQNRKDIEHLEILNRKSGVFSNSAFLIFATISLACSVLDRIIYSCLQDFLYIYVYIRINVYINTSFRNEWISENTKNPHGQSAEQTIPF